MKKEDFKFGAAYFPEHWEKERLEIDIKNMVEMGFTTVRMGEFAWSKFFPSDGSPIRTEWIDDAIMLLGDKGIKTIIGTPTATPPKYIYDKYDIAVVDERGNKYGFGSRRHYCTNSPDYLRVIKTIIPKLGRHYKDNKNIVGFQIDNEFGGDKSSKCYCDNCKKAFRLYLVEKFCTIENLNESLGTTAWNQTYCSFEEIDLPGYTQTVKNPHMELEYKRFQAISVTDFKNVQRQILLDINPGWEINTNIFEPGVDTDNRDLAIGDSYVAIDNYPNMSFERPQYEKHGMIMDMCFGYLNRPFISMETQCGTPGGSILFPTPRPGALMRNTLQSMGHGASGIIYFRYRTNSFGAEQYWHGILNHDGVTGRLFNEVKQTRSVISRAFHILTAKREARVAIIHDIEVHWAFEIQPLMLNYNYYAHILNYYKAFFKLGVSVDLINKDDDIDEYDIIVAPNSLFSNSDLASRLGDFITCGKTVIMDYRSGVKDSFNKAVKGKLPNAFSDLLGIEVSEYGIILDSDNIKVRFKDIESIAGNWYDCINLTSGSVCATFTNDYIDGYPAVTKNEINTGNAYYIGTKLQSEILEVLLEDICSKLNIKTYDLPNGIEVITKTNGLIIINHTQQNFMIEQFVGMMDIVNETNFNGRLEKGQVAVLVSK